MKNLLIKFKVLCSVSLCTALLFSLITIPTAFAAHSIDVLVDDGEVITVAAGNKVIGVDTAGANCDTVVAATLTEGTYTPTELATEIKTQIDVALVGTAVTVAYDYETRKFTITGNVDGDSICWAEADTTAETILGFAAVNDTDIDTTPAVSDTALSIGDRIYTTSSVGSTSTVMEFQIDVAGAADSVSTVTIVPPTGYTITGWNLFNADDGSDAADATDTPNMDGNAGDSTGCGDINRAVGPTAGLADCAADTEITGDGVSSLALALQTVVASGQTLVVQLYVDAAVAAGISGDWTVTTTDDNIAPADVSETFKVISADAGDIAFEIYPDGDALAGDVSAAASGSVYIFDADGAQMSIASYANIKKTLSSGLALYEDGTEFTSPGGGNGDFDYAVTGTDEKLIGDGATYDFDGISTFKAARTADVADPTITGMTVNTVGGKNVATFTLSEPLIYDTIITDADRSIASTSSFGDTTSESSGLTFAGIGKWTDSDGHPNTTNQTGANTVAINDQLTTITVTSNGQTGNYYYTNTSTGVAADDTNDNFTPAGTVIADAAANTVTAVAIGTGNITVTAGWDVTPLATVSNFQKSSATGTTDTFSWSAITDPGDFSAYWVSYDTDQITAATAPSLWTDSDDADLATVTTTSSDVTALTAGAQFYTRLIAKDTYGNISLATEFQTTGKSGGGGVKADKTGPKAPTGLSGSINSDLDVVLTWTDPTDSDLNKIQVMKSKDNVNFVLEKQIEAGIQIYTDTTAVEGEKLYYKLIALDARLNEGTASNVLTLEVKADAEEVVVEDVVEPEPVAEEDVTEAVPAEGATPTDEDATPELSDTANHWAREIIDTMVARGIVKGNPDGTFNPDGNLNRAEAAALLFRVLGMEEPAAPAEKPFNDVDTDTWYSGYVASLKEMGLANGHPDGTYQPGMPINRAEFLHLALNVYAHLADEAGKTEVEELRAGTVTDFYADLDAEAWYAGSVTAGTSLGFVSGIECGEGKCFNAAANITRAEATKILHSMFVN